MNYVGTGTPIHDARGKATGRLRYAADRTRPHMLHAAMVFSTIPHGYVTGVDASEALALEGVCGVFSRFNLPDYRYNRYRSMYSQELPEEEHVFPERVRFVGDRVAAVVAKDADTARRAAALVKVTYEPLPCALTFEDALEGRNCLEGENPICSEFSAEVGSSSPEESEAVKVEAFTEIARLHHAAMEPHACLAEYDPDLEELTIESPNQSVHGIRTVIGDMLQMPYSKLRVIKTPMGGSFGCKQEWILEPTAAVLAVCLRRPVRLVYDRAEVMRSTICRGAMRCTMTGHFLPDGSLKRLDVELLSDAGAYVGNSADYVRTLFGKLFRCYRIPHATIHARVVSTNTPVSGAFRGWSSPEGAIFMEHLMEKAARALGLDPVELRLKNVLLPGEMDIKTGVPIEEVRTRECLLRGAARFDWAARRAADAAFNASQTRYRRGTGVGCGGHGNTYFPRYNDFAGAELRMCEDGTVQANISVHDHGCGTVTAFTKILAETLQIPPEQIRLKEADTGTSPFDYGCFASRSTFVVGRAVQRCAENLREEMRRAAAQFLKVPLEDLWFDGCTLRCHGREDVALSYKEISWRTLSELQRELFAQERYHTNTNPGVTGTHFAQVEVDTWTGLVKVLDYLAVHDIGQAINPAMCVAQIQGAAQMGCGAALTEELSILPDGRSLNSLSKYHVLNAPDLPEIQVELIQDGTSLEGPYGAKSIGEVSMVPAAPAIAAAVNQALGSDLSVLPMNPDRILLYLRNLRTGGQ